MEFVSEIVAAADSPWGVVALLIVAFFALGWKYGKDVIVLLRETKSLAVQTKAVAEDVQTSIITNHGSKNLGDAIDRLTGWFMEQQEQDAEDRRVLHAVAQEVGSVGLKLENHIDDCRPLSELVQEIQKERARAAQH